MYRGLIDRESLDGLLSEALAGTGRYDALAAGCDDESVRGGKPARQMISIDGGPLQAALFASPQLMDFLSRKIGAPVRPFGDRASYSMYAGEGAHLDVHRDVPGCDLALIVCLHDSDPLASGGALDYWPDDLCTPLQHIRGSPESGRARLSLMPGESLLLHGGILPHRIPPIRGKRLRVVSVMCFEVMLGRVTHRPVRKWMPEYRLSAPAAFSRPVSHRHGLVSGTARA